jgi:hypothetical protein
MYRDLSTRSSIRQGASLARGTTIDAYLSEPDCRALYEQWDKSWPEPLEFPGGVQGLTCETVLDINYTEFRKVFGWRAKRIYDAARQYATTR